MTLSLGVSCPRGPRRRGPSGFCLRCRVHASAVRHLLQIMSPVEQPLHVPRKDGHLCRVLCSRGPQYPFHSCRCPWKLDTFPAPPPTKKSAKVNSQVSACFRQPLRGKCKSLRKCLNTVRLDQKNLWGTELYEGGWKNVGKLQSLFTFLPTGSLSPAM